MDVVGMDKESRFAPNDNHPGADFFTVRVLADFYRVWTSDYINPTAIRSVDKRVFRMRPMLATIAVVGGSESYAVDCIALRPMLCSLPSPLPLPCCNSFRSRHASFRIHFPLLIRPPVPNRKGNCERGERKQQHAQAELPLCRRPIRRHGPASFRRSANSRA